MMDKQTVTTGILTLEKADKHYQFIIPTYQRPYVWSDDDVLLLFNDIKSACEAKEDYYFIGTTLSSKHNKSSNIYYELIDGQQRATTLMLIAIAFNSPDKNDSHNPSKRSDSLYKYASYNGKPRLQFAIRDQVEQLLGSYAGLSDYKKPSDQIIEDDEYLKPINTALRVLMQEIRKIRKDSNNNAENLADFIYNKVQWVNNIVPKEVDLTRLFATMNTAGVQLEQVDILKAKLFKKIKTDIAQYDAIWLVCEQMGNYFERNVRQCFKESDWKELQYKDLAAFDKTKFIHARQDQDLIMSGLSIADIAIDAEKLTKRGKKTPTKPDQDETSTANEETIYCRSIISFPLLLIHAYRIYRVNKRQEDIGPKVQSDKLLEIFESLIALKESDIKAFIEFLWQARYQFDTWIVKWIENDESNQEQLTLTSLPSKKDNGGFNSRPLPKKLNALTMLESVIYFMGDQKSHYWITSFLGSIINKKLDIQDDKKVLTLLETIDNAESLTQNTLKETSFRQILSKENDLDTWSTKENYLKQSMGTNFERYWFQKLEYVLWKDINSNTLSGEEKKKFESYRITSKNSIEHVHQQNEEYGKALSSKSLHAFGNLVLLSTGENSSYSNQTVEKKQADFNGKPKYDSLKLRDIFSRPKKGKWDEGAVNDHQNDMISVLRKHYK